jgi:hypothetical protein
MNAHPRHNTHPTRSGCHAGGKKENCRENAQNAQKIQEEFDEII